MSVYFVEYDGGVLACQDLTFAMKQAQNLHMATVRTLREGQRRVVWDYVLDGRPCSDWSKWGGKYAA